MCNAVYVVLRFPVLVHLSDCMRSSLALAFLLLKSFAPWPYTQQRLFGGFFDSRNCETGRDCHVLFTSNSTLVSIRRIFLKQTIGLFPSTWYIFSVEGNTHKFLE